MGKHRVGRLEKGENKTPLNITEGDYEIFRYLANYKYMTSHQLSRVLLRKTHKLNDRQRRLINGDFLFAPKNQHVDKPAGGGSDKLIRALTRKGYREIGYENGTDHREVKRSTLMHELIRADLLTLAEQSTNNRENVEFVYPETPEIPLPKHLGSTLKLKPDDLFGIRFTDKPEGANTLWFFVEADNNTEPFTKKNEQNGASIFQKLKNYWWLHSSGYAKETLELKNFRVIFLTSGTTLRAKNMASLVERLDVKNSTEMFLFASQEAFRESDPLTFPWINGKGLIPTTIIDE